MIFEVEPMGGFSSYPTLLMSMTVQRFALFGAGFTSNWPSLVVGIMRTALEQVLHVLVLLSFQSLPSKRFRLIFCGKLNKVGQNFMLILTFCEVELDGAIAW